MSNKNFFKCPNCGHTVERTPVYLAVLDSQNFINLVMGNDEIVDLCGNCNYFEYKK